jgi:hypothetical protein
MKNNIHQLGNTCEPNETRLLNEPPLTKNLTEQDLHTVVGKHCTLPITQQVVWAPRLPTCNVTAFWLSWLIQNGELICNEINISYYEMIEYQPWNLLYGYNISTCIDHRRIGLSCS